MGTQYLDSILANMPTVGNIPEGTSKYLLFQSGGKTFLRFKEISGTTAVIHPHIIDDFKHEVSSAYTAKFYKEQGMQLWEIATPSDISSKVGVTVKNGGKARYNAKARRIALYGTSRYGSADRDEVSKLITKYFKQLGETITVVKTKK
jgi:hypothetical protein